MTLLNEADAVYVGGNAASKVYLGANLVWEPADEGEYEAEENIYPDSISYSTGIVDSSFAYGNRIKILTDGRITGIRWYAIGLSATWVSLWKDDGTLLVSEYTNVPIDTGWNTYEFTTPITVIPGQVVRVTRGHNGGNIVYVTGRWVSDSSNLEWLNGTSSTQLAVDAGGDNDFPVNLISTTNYPTDIMYQPLVDGYTLWTPNELVDYLYSWVDPSDYDTIVLSGSNVLTLYDKVVGRTFYGRKGASGPQIGNLPTLNSKQVLLFNNTNQGLISDFASAFYDFSVYAVFQKTGTNSGIYNTLIDHNYSTSWSIMRQPGTGELWGGGVIESVSPFGQYVVLAGDTGHQISSIREGTTHTVRGDGGAVIASRADTDTVTAANLIYLGDSSFANSYYSGYLGEVIILPIALSTEDHQKVEGYLAHKWGIQAKLPANHPYLLNAPSTTPPVKAVPTISSAHISNIENGVEITVAFATTSMWAVEGAVAGYPAPNLTYNWRINGGSVVGTGKSFSPTGLVSEGDDITVEIRATNSEGFAEATSNSVNITLVVAVTWNPADKSASITLADSNLRAFNSLASNSNIRATKFIDSAADKKWYCEFVYRTATNLNRVGVANAAVALSFTSGGGPGNAGIRFDPTLSQVSIRNINGATTTVTDTWADGDIIGMAIDQLNNKMYYHKNGVYYQSGNPSAGTGGDVLLVDILAAYGYIRNTTIGITLRSTAAQFTYPIPSGYVPYAEA